MPEQPKLQVADEGKSKAVSQSPKKSWKAPSILASGSDDTTADERFSEDAYIPD